jgi:hypothetical protein
MDALNKADVNGYSPIRASTEPLSSVKDCLRQLPRLGKMTYPRLFAAGVDPFAGDVLL